MNLFLLKKEKMTTIVYINFFRVKNRRKKAILKAVSILSSECEIELYADTVESDFATDEINWSEYEEREAEEILSE